MDTKEQKTPEKTVEANPEVNLMDKEPIVDAMEGASELKIATVVSAKKSNKYTIITIVIVVIALLVVLFQLERQDRVSTNVFGSMIAAIEANAPVATVNGDGINMADVESGIEQLTQAAIQQGFDTTDPEVQAEVRAQAIDMMINTKLLEQVAVKNDIIINEEAVDARINELAEAAGGQEALLERLKEFQIDEAQLRTDVQEELTIRALLDTVFSDAGTAVTEDEIAAVYQNALASNGDQPLPPLADVAAQIEQQLRQTKEQEATETYVQQLRADADITIN
jgi:FKBP-type peptidyl-prolyl cis-trans isomerase (trigger factor)